MPRGTDPLDAATINGRVWTPARLPPVATASGQVAIEAWYDAQDFSTVTTAAGAVSQWNDKSGNGRTLAQSTAGNRPAFVFADTLAPYWNLNFNGSTHTLNGPFPFMATRLAAGGSLCMMGIIRASTPGSGATVVGEANSASNNGFISTIRPNNTFTQISVSVTNDAATAVFTANVNLGLVLTTTSPNLYSYTLDQAGVAVFKPGEVGTPAARANPYGTITTDTFAVGSIPRLSAAGFWSGRVFEVVVMSSPDASFPQQMRWKAEAYLLWKYQTLLTTGGRRPLPENPLLFPRPPEIGA